jgi:hypothetical protein
MQAFPPRDKPFGSFDGWKLNPFNFYALWTYAKAGLGDPVQIFNSIDKTGSRRLLTPADPDYPDNSYFSSHPHVHNAYIAGYIGWLALEDMAGLPESGDKRAELNRLLALRASTFTWDLEPDDSNQIAAKYYYGFLISWNFMYLVPELAQYLRDHALGAVSQAVQVYQKMTPYWFVSKSEEVVQGETDYNSLYHYHGLFQAKALILRQPYYELEKYLDVPAFAVGDLFYIDNLIASLTMQTVTFTHGAHLPLVAGAGQQTALGRPPVESHVEDTTAATFPVATSPSRPAPIITSQPAPANELAVNVPFWLAIFLVCVLITGALRSFTLRHKRRS